MMLTSAALLLFNSLAPELTNHLITPSPQVSEGYVGLSSAALRQADDRPMLGVTLGEGGTSDEGAWVHGVVEGGPAEQAGLLSGDRIIKVGKKKIGDDQELIDAIQARDVGDNVKLRVMRGEERVDLRVRLGGLEEDVAMEKESAARPMQIIEGGDGSSWLVEQQNMVEGEVRPLRVRLDRETQREGERGRRREAVQRGDVDFWESEDGSVRHVEMHFEGDEMSEGQLRELLREHGIDLDLGELPMKGGEQHMRVHVERHVEEAPRRDRGRQSEAQRGRGGERRAGRGQDRRSARDRAGRGDRGRGDRARQGRGRRLDRDGWARERREERSRQGVRRWNQALDRLDRGRGWDRRDEWQRGQGERTRMERGWGRDRREHEMRGAWEELHREQEALERRRHEDWDRERREHDGGHREQHEGPIHHEGGDLHAEMEHLHEEHHRRQEELHHHGEEIHQRFERAHHELEEHISNRMHQIEEERGRLVEELERQMEEVMRQFDDASRQAEEEFHERARRIDEERERRMDEQRERHERLEREFEERLNHLHEREHEAHD
ncbi:MAG: PDZ domain-containing protein [Planctomycetes bacterium]|nr:PDZ domain-containing protein [Planctomycetota bacterium]